MRSRLMPPGVIPQMHMKSAALSAVAPEERDTGLAWTVGEVSVGAQAVAEQAGPQSLWEGPGVRGRRGRACVLRSFPVCAGTVGSRTGWQQAPGVSTALR